MIAFHNKSRDASTSRLSFQKNLSASELLDHLQGLAVDGEGDEDQEDHALDQLLRGGFVAHHDQAVVENGVHQRTDDHVGEANLGAAGDRQAAQDQGDQNLSLELVAG